MAARRVHKLEGNRSCANSSVAHGTRCCFRGDEAAREIRRPVRSGLRFTKRDAGRRTQHLKPTPEAGWGETGDALAFVALLPPHYRDCGRPARRRHERPEGHSRPFNCSDGCALCATGRSREAPTISRANRVKDPPNTGRGRSVKGICPLMFHRKRVTNWPQRRERLPSKLRVAGSSPAAPTTLQIGRRYRSHVRPFTQPGRSRRASLSTLYAVKALSAPEISTLSPRNSFFVLAYVPAPDSGPKSVRGALGNQARAGDRDRRLPGALAATAVLSTGQADPYAYQGVVAG